MTVIFSYSVFNTVTTCHSLHSFSVCGSELKELEIQLHDFLCSLLRRQQVLLSMCELLVDTSCSKFDIFQTITACNVSVFGHFSRSVSPTAAIKDSRTTNIKYINLVKLFLE